MRLKKSSITKRIHPLIDSIIYLCHLRTRIPQPAQDETWDPICWPPWVPDSCDDAAQTVKMTPGNRSGGQPERPGPGASDLS